MPKGAKRACKVSWHVLSMNKHAPIHKKGINFYIQFCVFAAGRAAYTEHTKDHPAKNQAGPKIGLYLARLAPKCWHFKKNPHCQHDTIFAKPLINKKLELYTYEQKFFIPAFGCIIGRGIFFDFFDDFSACHR